MKPSPRTSADRPEGQLFAAIRGQPGNPAPAEGKLVFVAAAEVAGIDALRHSVGYLLANRLMNAVCERIHESLESCEVGRSGRACVDFAFVANSRLEAQIQLARLATSAGQVAADGFKVDLALTIGVAPCGAAGAAEALELAEAALAEAQQRRLRVAFADELGTSASVGRVALARDLQSAIRAGELTLVYQPKVDARTRTVRAAEALVRWHHPTFGSVSPSVFVALAEETGSIRGLTEWTVERAALDRSRLAAAGHDIALHVNLSGHLVGDLDFAAWALSKLGNAASAMGFEITETAMIRDPDGALRNLQLYAEAGIHLSIDDYGAGFSSLAYLQKLPVRELKIDQSFITHLATSHRDPLLVRSTIDLAHALEMEVTAEGVETPEVLALLQVMGCDLLQGYAISRPLPLDGLLAYCGRGAEPSPASRFSLPRFRAASRA